MKARSRSSSTPTKRSKQGSVKKEKQQLQFPPRFQGIRIIRPRYLLSILMAEPD